MTTKIRTLVPATPGGAAVRLTPRTATRRILAGGLAIAIADAIVFSMFWWPLGVSPDRIFRGIAAGLFADAVHGGVAMTVAGIVLHVVNATLFVAIYAALARTIPALRSRPLLWGPPYGLAVWAGMTFVVIPLSRIGYQGPGRPSWAIASIAFHLTVVGIGAAWVSTRPAPRGAPVLEIR
jgi:hypothetical protein